MRRKRILIAVAVVGVLVMLLLGPGVNFYTDYLWYDDVGFTDFYTTRLFMQIVLFFAGAVVFALIMGTNVWLARRLSPLRPLAITNDFLFNLRRQLDPFIRWVLIALVVGLATLFGLATFPQWQEFLLWTNSSPTGDVDQQFGKDVSFYLFALPVWKFIFNWLFVAIVLTAISVGAVYAYAGAIGPNQPEGGYLAPQPRTHISILLGVLLLLKAVGYQIDQWELLYSERGGLTGAGFTDVNAQLPAFQVLFWIAIVAAILLFANFWIKRLFVPIVAIVLMLSAAFVVGGVYPWIVQTLQVNPNEIEKETPYAERNIEATRLAYGLENVMDEGFAPADTVTTEQLDESTDVLRNVRLWDDRPLLTSVKQIQELQPFYDFVREPGVDRYEIDDKLTQVLVSPREINTDQLDERQQTWQNEHLVYTHGYASVVTQSARIQGTGNPVFLVQDVPPVNKTDDPVLDIERPEIYFGDATDNFVIVNTTLDEIDPVNAITDEEGEEGVSEDTTGTDTDTTTTIPEDTDTTTTVPEDAEAEDTGTQADAPEDAQASEGDAGEGSDAAEDPGFEGDSGIKLDSLLKKLAFVVKFGDPKFILSDNIRPESRLMYDRQIGERVRKVAPFLVPDGSPFVVLDGGRLKWVVDTYTVSDLYPYSEFRDNVQPGVGRINYMRNSVKAVVDAYTGEVTLYRVDDLQPDPIVDAWDAAIPGMFTKPDLEDPDFVALSSHFRYPLDFFRVQLEMWTKYHVDNPQTLLKGNAEWEISTKAAEDVQNGQASPGQDVRSQYVMMRFGLEEESESDVEFVVLNSFTPKGKDNLRAVFIARSDPGHYGELVSFELPQNEQVNGPAQVEALINQTPDISSRITLLGQSGSQVILGEIRFVPLTDDALVYQQSLYVQSTENARPELKFVILVFRDKAVIAPTFNEALIQLFGYSPLLEADEVAPAEPVEPGDPLDPSGALPETPATPDGEVASIAAQASTVYDQMQEALRQGDLETYGRLEKELGELLTQLEQFVSGTAQESLPTETSVTPTATDS